MRKKFLSLALVGAVTLASMSTFVSCKNYDDDLKAQQELIEALAGTTSELESQLTSTKTELEGKLATVNTKLAAAEESLAGLAAADEKISQDVAQLRSDLTAQKTALEAQIATCNAAIAELQSAVAGKVSQTEYNAFVADASAKLAALTGNYDQLAADLNKLSTETGTSIASILKSVADLQAKDTELSEGLTAAQKQIADNKAELLKKIADEKADVQAKITAEEAARIAAVENLQNQVTALQNWQKEINTWKGEMDSWKGIMDAWKGDIDAWKSETSTKLAKAIEDITALTGRVAANEAAIKTIKEEMAKINDTLASLQGQINILAVLMEKNITSLVFKPSQYLYGFGTIEVQSFTGCNIYESKKSTEAGYTEIDEYSVTDEKSKWAPNAHARYHLNPSTADIEKYNFEFLDVETKNYLTRAGYEKKIGAEAKKVKVENGVLDVEVRIKYPENLNDATTKYENVEGTKVPSYAEVSTLALQATKKDADKVNDTQSVAAGTVTSDYAIVVPSYYGDLVLANNEKPTDHSEGDNASNHIRKSAVETIKDAKISLEVAYNGTKDLKSVIETHYGVAKTAEGAKLTHKGFSKDEFEASEMTYKYEIVKYEGSSEGATVDDGVVSVKEKDAKYIGEKFVVRILLLDGNNKVVCVGYVKILITDQGATPATDNLSIVLNCEDPTSTSTLMSGIVDQFKKSYNSALEVADFNGNSGKYTLDTQIYVEKDGQKALADLNGNFEIKDGKLVLNLTEGDITKLYLNEKGFVVAKDVTVYAKFTHGAEFLGYSDLWVKLTINEVVYAKGTFADADKIVAYWYEKDSKTPATAGKYDEIHANVSVPESSSTPTFDFNMLNTFVGAKAKISGIDARLTAFTANPIADFYIADTENNKRVVNGASEKKYQLVVKDNKTLAAYDIADATKAEQEVVVLDLTSDNKNGIAKFQHTDYAEDILNYAAHTKLDSKETFWVEIGMEKIDKCYNVELTNDKFQVKFLRPINISDNNPKATKDAEIGGGFWYAQDFVNFTDWRDYKSSQISNFFSFYGIGTEAIVPVDLNEATTNINGNPNDKLNAVAPNIKLTWDGTDATRSQIHGKIGYVNNGATINKSFEIYVPIAINYAWGTIYTKATLTVDPTVGNARKQ